MVPPLFLSSQALFPLFCLMYATLQLLWTPEMLLAVALSASLATQQAGMYGSCHAQVSSVPKLYPCLSLHDPQRGGLSNQHTQCGACTVVFPCVKDALVSMPCGVERAALLQASKRIWSLLKPAAELAYRIAA